jgi:hypothetical protein
MTRTQVLVAAAAVCTLSAVPAHAQRRPAAPAHRPAAAAASASAEAGQPAVIRMGQTLQGTLSDADPRMTERGRFRVYRFNGQRGQKVIATLRSADFDAYLTVARMVSGITDAIATDDDRGGGEKNTDARVRVTLPQDGAYLIVAQALQEDGVGGYTLSLTPAPVPTTAASRPISIGQSVSGRLDETDAVLDDDDTYYDTWTFSARKGQRLAIEMKADTGTIDPYLQFGQMEGGQWKSIRNDDDGGDGLNSRMVVTVPDDGQFVIRANEVGEKTGAYTLSVTERPQAATTATPHPIEPNSEVQGNLTDEDPSIEDGSYYNYWTYEGHAGERVRITMTSDDFDTFVALGTLDGATFTELASNDDGEGSGTNSTLEFTLPNNGHYVIRANSLSAGQTGAYKLKIEPQH